MTVDEPIRGDRRTTWPSRATALLLLFLGIYPLADRLGVAEPQLWWRRAWHAWLLWVPLVLLVAVALARTGPARWERWRDVAARRLLAIPARTFALAVAALTTSLSLIAGWLMFASQPVTIDELSELWQAHVLAHGRLFALAEPHPEFFSTLQTVTYEGRWFAHFPVGGPALQAIGLLLRAPWLANPLLAGVAAAAVYRFAAAMGEETEARVAALLVALSPFVLILAGSRLDHVGALAAAWIALAALPAWHAAADVRSASRASAIIGVALGTAVAIRPYDGAVVTLVVGMFQCLTAGRRTVQWRALVVQGLAGALPVAALLGVNRALTGHPLTFAYDVLNGPDHRPGFHLSPLGFQHTPLTGLFRVSTYVMRLNAALLGWPVPIIALVAITLLLRRRATRWDQLLLAYLAATFAAYWLYWGDGSFHGPRFLFEVAPIFLLNVARFPAAVRTRLSRPLPRAAALLLVPLWAAAAWLVPPSRYQPFSALNLTVRSTERNHPADTLAARVAGLGLHHALVFVDDGWHGRLTARLRALGVAPFRAQLLAGNWDACALQQRIDEVERQRLSPTDAARAIEAFAAAPNDAQPVPGLAALEQIALSPSAPSSPSCAAERVHAYANGLDFARLLPRMSLDANGRLDADVVYARELGARDSLLRDRFPGRSWYLARAERRGADVAIVLEPFAGTR